MPAEAEARVAPMAGQAVRVVNVSVDKGLFSSVGRACAPKMYGHGFDPRRRLCWKVPEQARKVGKGMVDA